VVIGFLTIQPLLFGDFFKDSIAGDIAHHPAMQELQSHFHSAAGMAAHALQTIPFWFALAGVVVAWWFYLKQPSIPAALQARFGFVYRLLDNKYYMDWINEHVFAAGARLVGTGLWKGGDTALIDRAAIDGSARVVGGIAGLVRLVQSGYLYWYALVMIVGVIGLMTWQLWPYLSTLGSR
jgi:NADH-quinone oxidoreductase subunit L